MNQNSGCIYPPDASLYDCYCWGTKLAICDSPTKSPTKIPTNQPTVSPTFKNCNEWGLY